MKMQIPARAGIPQNFPPEKMKSTISLICAGLRASEIAATRNGAAMLDAARKCLLEGWCVERQWF
jgi:hypothetical protein